MNIPTYLKAIKQPTICFLLLLGLLGGCSEHNDEFPGLPEEVANKVFAPSANRLIYSLVNVTGPVLTGTYAFSDPGGLDDASTYYWLADGVPITGATSTELDVSVPLTDINGDPVDLNTDTITFCVRPTNSSGLKGDDVCSPPIIVTSTDDGTAIISPPAATNLSYTPVSGPALNGVYTFADPQSLSDASTYYWLADGIPITGATQTTLDLSGPLIDTNGNTVDLNTDTISFCVRPTNSATIVGTDACSPPIVAVPSAAGLSYGPSPVTAGSTLTGAYTFNDTFNLADSSTYYWLANGVVITGANQVTLDTSSPLTDANGNPVVVAGTTFSFCVTPTNSLGITGAPVCVSPPSVLATDPTMAGGSNDQGVPFEGDTITGTYTYVPGDDSSPESGSVGVWKLDGVDSGITCSPANGCEFTLATGDIGKMVEYCIRPVSASGLSGVETCSTAKAGVSIKIQGLFEYGSLINAVTSGFTGVTTNRWLVDTDDMTGPLNDTNKTVPSYGSSTTLQYTIGTITQAATAGDVLPSPGDTTPDDDAWIQNVTGNAPNLVAGHFIGKDIQYCLVGSNEYPIGTYPDGICRNASEFQADNGTPCFDSAQCVKGGIYYDYPDIFKRGVEPNPIKGFTVSGKTVAFRRPITTDEIEFIRAGTVLTLQNYSTSMPLWDGTHTTLGMDFPLYSLGDPSSAHSAIAFCDAQSTVSDYHLPLGSDGDTDGYTGPPNNNVAPTDASKNLDLFFGSYRSNASFGNIGPESGWPFTTQYWNATYDGNTPFKSDFTVTPPASPHSAASSSDLYMVLCIYAAP